MTRHAAPLAWFWTLAICGAVFLLLLVRGLDYGPLHTDVIIIRAWFAEHGLTGFSGHYWAVNQRHILVGPLYTAAYSIFGSQDLPYNVIFHSSRLLSGVMLSALLGQLRVPVRSAILAGVALAVTPVRVAELFQSINWFIEPTLTLLLASSYGYARSLNLRDRSPAWHARGWFVFSTVFYVISILIYESGLPWILVNVAIGWHMRPGSRPSRRLAGALGDALPSLIIGGLVAILVLVVFVPWTSLSPDMGGLGMRLARNLGEALLFLLLVLGRIWEMRRDGYLPQLVLCAVAVALGAALVLWIINRRCARSDRSTFADSGQPPLTAVPMMVLGGIMILASILVGTSAREANLEYLDRINFARSAGIAVCFVGLVEALITRIRWSQPAFIVGAVLLVAPGLALLFRYQDAAQQSRMLIPRMSSAVQEIRRSIYLPAHLVILTNWQFPLAKFNNASDVILHQTQQALFEANEPATIELLKMGAFEESYVTESHTCTTLSGEAPAGMCLDHDQVVNSRWSALTTTPYEDVVLVYWDGQRLEIVNEVRLEALWQCGFNIATAGATSLHSSLLRVAGPVQGRQIDSVLLCGH